MSKIGFVNVEEAAGGLVYPVFKKFANPTMKNGYEEKQLNMREYNMVCDNGDIVVFRVDMEYPYQVMFVQSRKNNRVYKAGRYGCKYMSAMIDAAYYIKENNK